MASMFAHPLLFYMPLVSSVLANSPFKATSSSYGFEVEATGAGTKLKYIDPGTNAQGATLNNPHVKVEDASLNMALITPVLASIISKHPKLSVEGDSKSYTYTLKKSNKRDKTSTKGIIWRSNIMQASKAANRAKPRQHINQNQGYTSNPPDEPPELDIPIELGIEKTENEKEKEEPDKNPHINDGNTCDEKSCNNDEQIDSINTVGSGEETPLFSGDERLEQNNTIEALKTSSGRGELKGENELEFQPKAPEIPIELGLAIEEDNDSENAQAVVECQGRRKPCQKNCAKSKSCPPNESPPEPDIPIELGSNIFETGVPHNAEDFEVGDDEIMYLPHSFLPTDFVLIDESENFAKNPGGSVELFDTRSKINDKSEYYAEAQKQNQINDNQPIRLKDKQPFKTKLERTSNDDGDFDGELLTSAVDDFEVQSKHNGVSSAYSRKKRSLVSEKESVGDGQNNSDKYMERNDVTKKTFENIKQSEEKIYGDNTKLRDTVAKTNSEAGVKRSFTGKDKPLQGYMQKLADDVRSVMGEAKSVLRNTGRVVHGLKRVISGATVLTSFTNNAVKFAKYFSMEPDNSTIDYLEEKAVVALLESQKAAQEAKNAARLAKFASEKAQAAERRMEVLTQHHGNLEAAFPYIQIANKQASKAKRLAKHAVQSEKKTEADVLLVDTELSKMSNQLGFKNTEVEPILKVNKTSGLKESNELPKDLKLELNRTMGNLKKATEMHMGNMSNAHYEDYFYKKQKQLEEALKDRSVQETSEALNNLLSEVKNMKEDEKLASQSDVKSASNQRNPVTVPVSQSFERFSESPTLDIVPDTKAKLQESPILNDSPMDPDDIKYIASLNSKIAAIKKEEEETKQKLKAIYSRTVASGVRQEDSTLRKLGITDTILRSTIKKSDSKNSKADLTNSKPTLKAINENRVKKDRTVTFERQNNRKLHKATDQVRDKKIHSPVGNEYSGIRKQLIQTSAKKAEASPTSKLLIYHSDVVHPTERKSDEAIIRAELQGIDEGSESDNSLVTDDFNDGDAKKEKVLFESKLLNDKLSNLNHELKIASEKRRKDDLFQNFKIKRNKKTGYKQSYKKGPVSVTVQLNRDPYEKNYFSNQKNKEFLQAYGINGQDTSEQGVVERTRIPKPDDYYKVVYQRSYIPHQERSQDPVIIESKLRSSV